MLKIALLLVKNVFFAFDWGISELACWVDPKHTALHIPSVNIILTGFI